MWPAPSSGTVRAIRARLDPAMVALVHEGEAAFRDRQRRRPPATEVALTWFRGYLSTDNHGKRLKRP